MSHLTTIKFRDYYISRFLPKNALEYKVGYGINNVKRDAIIAAKSEFYERDRISDCSKENLIFAKWEKLDNCIPKSQLSDASNCFKPHIDYYWTSVIDFKSKKENLIPASAIFFPFNAVNIAFEDQTTVGTAAFYEEKTAFKKSVLEIIERHSYYMALIGEFTTSFIKKEDETTFYHINNTFQCSIVIAIIRKESIPYVSSGISANDNFQNAIAHARKEAWLSYWVACKLRKEIINNENILLENIDQPFVQFAFDKNFRDHLDFLSDNNHKENSNLANEDIFYSKVMERFGNIYFKTFFDPKYDIKVVRSFIPGAITNHNQFFREFTKTPKPLF